MKVREIIEVLKEFHPAVNEERTTDTVKLGDIDVECTGIVVTCCATIEVIRKAIELGANFIIGHEDIFYNHEDATKWLEGNAVYEAKRKLLENHSIVVWRDHDHIHGGPPSKVPENKDLIYYGIMKELGWEEYVIGNKLKPLRYRLPATTVKDLAKELCDKLNLNGMRIVGNADADVSKVFICEHIPGMEKDNQAVCVAEEEDIDVLIPLEIVDWTLSAYVRDAASLGKNKVILEMGHFNFEEPGMKYMEKWLSSLIKEDVPIHYVQSGDTYSYFIR